MQQLGRRRPCRVDLFYDVVSPYSWVAFEVLSRYRKVWHINLVLRPFFLGGVMQATGNKPPATLPAKQVYMLKDIVRLRDFYGVPMSFPSDFASVMMGTLPCQRLLTSVQHHGGQAKVEALSREMWLRIWSRDESCRTEEDFRMAMRVAGFDNELANKCLLGMTDPSVKEELKRTTQEAIDLGAFGAPCTVLYHDDDDDDGGGGGGGRGGGGSKEPELYFGSDRFELIAFALGEKWYGAHPLVSSLPSSNSKL